MTVFILGAGPMQIPAIRSAHEMGWLVAAADGNPQAVGAVLADRFYPVDLKDLPGLEAAAREVRASLGLDAVFTAGTDFSAPVAWLAGRLGLPGIPYEAALRASDKLKMRAAFAAAGLASPRFLAVTRAQDALDAAREAGLELPLVVKPADNMGARGCRLARSPADLEAACAAALPFSRSGRAIVEEYLDGPEFSLDALIVDGQVVLRGFADRHISFSPYFVELGHTIPTAAPKEIVAEVLRVFGEGIKAIGLTTGAAKGDMKWCPGRGQDGKGRAMIGEIAARLSGGYMSGWTYPYASGLDLTTAGLLVAAGRRPDLSTPDRGWTSAERAFISIPGRVAAIVGLREAEYSPWVKNVFCRVGVGDSCVFPANNVEKCGNIISQAPDRATAAKAAEDAVRGIVVRLEPGRPETEAFLSGQGESILNPDGSTWPPLAFSLPSSTAWQGLPASGQAPTAKGVQELRILALPGLEAPGVQDQRDWSGRTLGDSVSLALALGGGTLLPGDGKGADPDLLALSGRFWAALSRAGAQGGLYVLDTARALETGR